MPADVPYAYCSPTSWPDYDSDNSGWITIEAKSSDYRSKSTAKYDKFNSFNAHSSSSSTSVSGGASYFGIGASGGYHRADAHADQQSSGGHTATTSFHNDAKNVTIKFQFGIVDIVRPWLLGDLFYLKNWYMVGQKKNFVSDGTIDGQADSDRNLLPMIPMQMLVVRNLTIHAESWGRDQATMDHLFGESKGAWDSSSSGYSAGVGFSCGLFSATANVSHEQAKSGASTYGRVDSNKWSEHEAHFEKNTLSIKGAQIVAFLCTIVPPCPQIDDPGLGQKAAPASGATATPAPAAQPATAAKAPEPAPVR